MRDFARTGEPRGAHRHSGKRVRAVQRSFVVQKHDARNLHYDFRLELDDVLLSWALPKGPSRDPKVKRLAVEVEPHPIEYGSFEGTIPEGEYGGGTVMLWDRGSWTPLGDPHEGIAKGHLEFELSGEKLKGAWHLVRTKLSRGSKEGKNWLLIKAKDAEATANDTLLEDASKSVKSGFDLEQIAYLPDVPEPELATLVERPPPGDEWLHEIKLDGYRILARIGGGGATLHTRNGKDWSERMPGLREVLQATGLEGTILDGELVAMNSKGISDFQTLQNSLKEDREAELVYYVFDLLHEGHDDLRDLPLFERKARLKNLLARHEKALGDQVRFSDHVIGHGQRFFENACKAGQEGTVAKRLQSPYRSGRGRDWLKIKGGQRQEFTLIGFTDPSGTRDHLGALLLGVMRGGELTYAGKVGTGFSDASLKELNQKLRPLVTKHSPLAKPPTGAKARGVTWVEPRLVAEIAFTEQTKDGLLRHPTFRGLREDKPSREVKMERPSKAAADAASYSLTHPDKVLYPEQGITKRELLDYYALVADRMLPHLVDRPLTLVRCPNGRDKQCFFQKHPAGGALPGVQTVTVPEKSGSAEYNTVGENTGLFGLVQLGALEIHTWGSRTSDIEHPDILVLDLDPDPSAGYEAVITAAKALHRIFEQAKLESFVKTTGGKGVHVCVPLVPSLSWDVAKDFTRRLAESLANHSPDLYVANQSKAKRKGKVFIDYLRNARGASFVAPYSTRARENCPIAVPLEWDELSTKLPPDHFTLRNIAARLAKLKRDPFERLAQLKQRLAVPADSAVAAK